MSSTSLALDHDATIRLNDYVCTEGAFDLQEEKHREVLRTCPAVGLRALRDRRLVSMQHNASAFSSAARAAASAQQAAADAKKSGDGSGGDLVPVSPNMLEFLHGPSSSSSSGSHKHRHRNQHNRVPSRTSHRQSHGEKSDDNENDDGDNDSDEDNLNDDAALLRSAMAEAKKRRKAEIAAGAQAQFCATVPGYFANREPSEREQNFLRMVDKAIPILIGTSAVRLFGVAIEVTASHATVQVWRRGSTIYTDKRPLEVLPLPSLQKLARREFHLCVNRPLVAFADTKTRKSVSGAVSVEDMPATLMAHTNEIVESLIKKMHKAGEVQQQAVLEELSAMRQTALDKTQAKLAAARRSGSASPAGSLSVHVKHHQQQRRMQQQQQPQHHQQQHQHDEHHHPDDLLDVTTSNSQANVHSRVVTPTPFLTTTGSADAGLPPLSPTPDPGTRKEGQIHHQQHHGHHHHPNPHHQHQQHQHVKINVAEYKLALGKDRHLLRGSTLKNRVLSQARRTVAAGSPLLQRYLEGGKCGIAVVRSLPEPPVTRLIDPLVDVREDLKSLSMGIAGGGGGGGGERKYKPQSEYILSMQRMDGARGGDSAGGAKSKTFGEDGANSSSSVSAVLSASGSLIPVLGMKNRPGSGSSSAATPQAKNRPLSGSNFNNKTTTATSSQGATSKLPPPAPSFVELALEQIRSPELQARISSSPQHQQHNGRSSSDLQQPVVTSGRAVSTPTSDLSTFHVHGRSQHHRVMQPMPPCLLYSSYAADSDLLPPEIPCTVDEYRPWDQTLVMTVRRAAFGASAGTPGGTGRGGSGGGGGAVGSSAAALAASKRKTSTSSSSGGGGGSNQNTGRSPGAASSSYPVGNNNNSNVPQPLTAAQQQLKQQQKEALQAKWHAAVMGLSTILVKCAFVEVLRNGEAADFAEKHHQRRTQLLQQRLEQSPHSASLQLPTTGSSTAAESGDDYLAGLEGKVVDIVPLWSVVSSSSSSGRSDEYAVVADIQRGDLSILDEMVSRKVAAVSSEALNEFNELRAVFGGKHQQQQQQQQSKSSPQPASSFSWAKTRLSSSILAPTRQGSTLEFSGIGREESSNVGSEHGASKGDDDDDDNDDEREEGDLRVEKGNKNQNERDKYDDEDEDDGEINKGNTDRFAASENMQAISRLKSSYFSPSAARAVVEQDPDRSCNAAESFLGRRVFRLAAQQNGAGGNKNKNTANTSSGGYANNNNNNNVDLDSGRSNSNSRSKNSIGARDKKPMNLGLGGTEGVVQESCSVGFADQDSD